MLSYLIDLMQRAGSAGYVVVFIGAMLESAAFLGLLVPGESLVLFAGFLAGQGVFDLEPLILVVACGAAIGDNIGYELGRHLGRSWAVRYGERLGMTEQRLQRAEAFFSKHGGKAVALGRFIGFARALVPFVAGSVRMRYLTFLFYNAVGAALWAVTFVLVGYFLGQAAERWAGRASAIVAGIVAFVLVLLWLWRWLADHESVVKKAWAAARYHPGVVAAVEWLRPYAAWVRRRLSPRSYFGLQLTLGVVAFCAAAWVFGGISEDVVSRDPLTGVDTSLALWFAAHQQSAVTSFMLKLTRAHEWPGIALATVTVIGYLAWKGQWQWAMLTACGVAGGTALNVAMKLIFHRARPTYSGLSAALQSYSFPSGHTVAATVLYGALALYLLSRLPAWRMRVLVVLAAVLMVSLVALSRLYLGVHYLSDVMAAAAEGVAWLALCHVALNTYIHRRPLS